jgi:haloalkane dehalogenase
MNRKFIYVDGRTVCYRTWGTQGPVVLALHGSPQSSRAVAPVCEFLAQKGFQVIAPDTAGNGLSDGLVQSEKTSIVDYAAALHNFVDALGMTEHGIYGFHTGATVACAYAALYPQQVNSVLFDGLPSWSADELESLIGYLKSFEPSWDGSHMTWIWARMEQQTVFFPWHQSSSSYRMDYDVASVEACNANVMDFLLSKNNHIQPYNEALIFDPSNWLNLLDCPYLCAASQEDVLAEHLTRPAFKGITPYIYQDREQMYDAALQLFNKNKSAAVVLQEPARRPGGFVKFGEGKVYWQGHHGAHSEFPTLVFIHGSGDSSTIFGRLTKSMAMFTSCISLDLPGHGYSKDTSSLENVSISSLAAHYHEACTELGLENYLIVGQRLGAIIGQVMLQQKFITQAVCIDTHDKLSADEWLDLDKIDSSLEPAWDGSHLLRAWRIARWETLFKPWFKRDKQHATVISGSVLNPIETQKRAERLLLARGEWLLALQLESASPEATNNNADLKAFSTLSEGEGKAAKQELLARSPENWFNRLAQHFNFINQTQMCDI